MRKLVYAINLTLDGCVDHTKGVADEEVHDYFTQLLREFDVLLYGRKTYELMVPFWPNVARDKSGSTKAINDFAEAFAAVKQVVVVSKTLERVDNPNTRIVRTDLEGEVRRLKQEAGKNILVGGVDLPSQLIELGLVDEFIFVIQPVVVGQGRRLLDATNLPEKLQLKLKDSRTFRSGGTALRFIRRAEQSAD